MAQFRHALLAGIGQGGPPGAVQNQFDQVIGRRVRALHERIVPPDVFAQRLGHLCDLLQALSGNLGVQIVGQNLAGVLVLET